MSALVDSPRLRRVITASILAMFAINVDFFSVQAALPDMAHDLDTTVTDLQWVLSGFLLITSCLFIVGGRIADIQGRRRWMLIGACIFGVGSLIAGAGQSSEMVIGGRLVQGVGAAILFPVCLAVVTNAFPPDRTQRAVGLVFGLAAIGNAVGPFVGGLLTSVASWRWVLWFNVPIAVAIFVLALTSVEESRDSSVPRVIDWAGVVVIAASLAVFTFGVDGTADWGWGSPLALGLMAAGLAGMVGFVALERRVRYPLVDLALFRIREFTVMILAGIVGNSTQVVAIFLSMIYLQNVEGLSPVAAGTAFLAFSLGATLGDQFSGRVERFPSWAAMDVALVIGGLGAIGMGIATGSEAAFLLVSFPAGAGLGFSWSFASVVTQSVAPPEKAGAASGVVLTGLVGIAGVAVAVASSALEGDTGDPTSAIGGILIAFGVVAILVVPIVTVLGRGRTAAATAPPTS